MTIAYLNCPRCGLSLRTHAGRSADPECPRCFGRVGLRVPMYETERARPPGTGAPDPGPRRIAEPVAPGGPVPFTRE